MDMSAALTAQTALTRQAVALSVIRQNADAAQQLVAILDEAVRSVPVSASRGANVNTQA